MLENVVIRHISLDIEAKKMTEPAVWVVRYNQSPSSARAPGYFATTSLGAVVIDVNTAIGLNTTASGRSLSYYANSTGDGQVDVGTGLIVPRPDYLTEIAVAGARFGQDINVAPGMLDPDLASGVIPYLDDAINLLDNFSPNTGIWTPNTHLGPMGVSSLHSQTLEMLVPACSLALQAKPPRLMR